MAHKESILVDDVELVLIDWSVKNKPVRFNATRDQITAIRFQKCTEKKGLFKTVDSEKIVIALSGRQPVSYFKYAEGEANFETYKKQLEAFAKNNRINFTSEL